jgi:hypothetical protein
MTADKDFGANYFLAGQSHMIVAAYTEGERQGAFPVFGDENRRGRRAFLALYDAAGDRRHELCN